MTSNLRSTTNVYHHQVNITRLLYILATEDLPIEFAKYLRVTKHVDCCGDGRS